MIHSDPTCQHCVYYQASKSECLDRGIPVQPTDTCRRYTPAQAVGGPVQEDRVIWLTARRGAPTEPAGVRLYPPNSGPGLRLNVEFVRNWLRRQGQPPQRAHVGVLRSAHEIWMRFDPAAGYRVSCHRGGWWSVGGRKLARMLISLGLQPGLYGYRESVSDWRIAVFRLLGHDAKMAPEGSLPDGVDR